MNATARTVQTPSARIQTQAHRVAQQGPGPQFGAQEEPGLATRRFPARTAIKYLYLRAWREHRFIAVWVVVVKGRLIVRSWNDKPTGWYRAFLKHRVGHIRIGVRQVPVRALRVNSPSLNAAADAAYAFKYTTKSNRQYVEGFATPSRHATTLELVRP
jgi:hypothetical protein